MWLPENVTEQEFVSVVKRIVNRLAPKFRFGFVELDDIHQQAFIICMEALKKWDPSLPLDSYLWMCLKNRLCNFKRDEYERLDKPCLKCPFYNKVAAKKGKHDCKEFEDKNDCQKYIDWQKRNEIKKALVNAASGGEADHDATSYEHDYERADKQAIVDLIDRELPIELREDYIKYTHGIRLHKLKEQVLLDTLKTIIQEAGIQYDC